MILNIEEYIKPGTSKSLRNWIIFTNQHHNSHRTHQETISKFRGTELGEYLDFDKLKPEPIKPEPIKPEPKPSRFMKCIKDYEVVSFPHSTQIKEGETLEVIGYLMGRDIVLQADPEEHPPYYKHLTHVSFVIFEKSTLTEHFKEIY